MLGMVRIVILHDCNSVVCMLTLAFRRGDMLSPSAEFVSAACYSETSIST